MEKEIDMKVVLALKYIQRNIILRCGTNNPAEKIN